MKQRLARIIGKYLGKNAARSATQRKAGVGALPLPKELKHSKSVG